MDPLIISYLQAERELQMTIYLILWAISGLFVPIIIAPED